MEKDDAGSRQHITNAFEKLGSRLVDEFRKLVLCPANNWAAFPVHATSVAFVFSRKNATEVACTSRMNMVRLFPGHNTSG
jgi:hypothetical protein